MGVILQTERSPVQFPVSAYAWVVGQIPGLGHVKSNQSVFLSHIIVYIPFSLPSLLSKNKQIKSFLKTVINNYKVNLEEKKQ